MSLTAVISPVAAPQKLSQPAFQLPPDAFTKPFDALLPIMARLPHDRSEPAIEDVSLLGQDYIEAQAGVSVPGTLPYAEARRGVSYTHARLPRADTAARQLWTALHGLRPLTTDYAGDFQGPARRVAPHPISAKAAAAGAATCPFAAQSTPALDLIRRVFNWSALAMPVESSGQFYGVIFRSRRAPGSESTNLYSADRRAHEEAVNAGGLLMYFYGAPDPVTGTNLATCIWTSRADAVRASRLPWHAEAAAHARHAYSTYELSRYRVVKEEGEATLRIESWPEDEY